MNHNAEGPGLWQTNYDTRDAKNLSKSEKFQEALNDVRLMIWKRYLAGIANNPNMTKKEVCHHLGLKVGTINSIQQHYKLQSPFYYKKPKSRKQRKTHTNTKVTGDSKNHNKTIDSNISDKEVISKEGNEQKSKNKKKQKIEDNLVAKGYDFDETFNKSINSLTDSFKSMSQT